MKDGKRKTKNVRERVNIGMSKAGKKRENGEYSKGGGERTDEEERGNK